MTLASPETVPPIPLRDVAYFQVVPGQDSELTADLFRIAGDKAKALVLAGFATGTTPNVLNPHIKALTEKGIPVFILSKNPANEHGIRKIKYQVQQDAVEAGAIPLRDPNVNNDVEVLTSIQQAINDGKTGEQLTQAVVEKYGSPPPIKTSP